MVGEEVYFFALRAAVVGGGLVLGSAFGTL